MPTAEPKMMSAVCELTGWSEADIRSVEQVPWSDHVEVRRWSGRKKILSGLKISQKLARKPRDVPDWVERVAAFIIVDDLTLLPAPKLNPTTLAWFMAEYHDQAHGVTRR